MPQPTCITSFEVTRVPITTRSTFPVSGLRSPPICLSQAGKEENAVKSSDFYSSASATGKGWESSLGWVEDSHMLLSCSLLIRINGSRSTVSIAGSRLTFCHFLLLLRREIKHKAHVETEDFLSSQMSFLQRYKALIRPKCSRFLDLYWYQSVLDWRSFLFTGLNFVLVW